MFSRLFQLRLLSVLLTLVLAAPPLGGRWADRPAALAASSQPSGTTTPLLGVACPSPSTCLAVGWEGMILRSTDGGQHLEQNPRTMHGVRVCDPTTSASLRVDKTGLGQGSHRR